MLFYCVVVFLLFSKTVESAIFKINTIHNFKVYFKFNSWVYKMKLLPIISCSVLMVIRETVAYERNAKQKFTEVIRSSLITLKGLT